jgi:ankyrin repeat protein
MAGREELMAAVKEGDLARVRALLREQPGLARARDAAGVSAILLALYHRHREVADALAEAAPALDVFEAAALGTVDRLRAILAAEAGGVHAWSPDGFTPLALACFFRREEAARLLMEAGADVRAAARNPMRVTPLHAAAAARSVSIVRLLLERGAEADARQQMGYTALHAAAQHGDVDMAELLLAHGADPALRSDDGKDAAAHAREKGHAALAEKLSAR